MQKSKKKCHIVRLVLQSKDAGKTTSKLNEISHDFEYLPPNIHQFIYVFFPSFHKCDTFSIVSQNSNQIIIGIASSNKTFQYFLSDIKLYFDKQTMSITKLTGNVQMHSTKWNKESKVSNEETNLCPYTIEFKEIMNLWLPFQSSYMQEMEYEGNRRYRIDEMHYQY